MIQSPFRYPGSKNKMLPILMKYIDPLVSKDNKFIDFFVGGGSVVLEVASKFPNAQLFINDKDFWIYSFWKIVVDGNDKELQDLFLFIDQPPTLDLFYKLRASSPVDLIGAAYRAIYFNRTTFSGILSSGPIGGKDQLSRYKIDCRYNAKKIKDKILKCRNLLKGRTTVTNNDVTQHVLITSNYTSYLDPPYYKKGKTLYPIFMSNKEHEDLAKILQIRQNWILSYDDCDEVRNLYKNNNIIDLAVRYSINGKKDIWENKNEVIIIP
jgi:DNA adenine methylase